MFDSFDGPVVRFTFIDDDERPATITAYMTDGRTVTYTPVGEPLKFRRAKGWGYSSSDSDDAAVNIQAWTTGEQGV